MKYERRLLRRIEQHLAQLRTYKAGTIASGAATLAKDYAERIAGLEQERTACLARLDQIEHPTPRWQRRRQEVAVSASS